MYNVYSIKKAEGWWMCV